MKKNSTLYRFLWTFFISALFSAHVTRPETIADEQEPQEQQLHEHTVSKTDVTLAAVAVTSIIAGAVTCVRYGYGASLYAAVKKPLQAVACGLCAGGGFMAGLLGVGMLTKDTIRTTMQYSVWDPMEKGLHDGLYDAFAKTVFEGEYVKHKLIESEKVEALLEQFNQIMQKTINNFNVAVSRTVLNADRYATLLAQTESSLSTVMQDLTNLVNSSVLNADQSALLINRAQQIVDGATQKVKQTLDASLLKRENADNFVQGLPAASGRAVVNTLFSPVKQVGKAVGNVWEEIFG